MKEIKSISCVTSAGSVHEYTVGYSGVLDILFVEASRDEHGSCSPGYYEVNHMEGRCVRISELCPVVVSYINKGTNILKQPNIS